MAYVCPCPTAAHIPGDSFICFLCEGDLFSESRTRRRTTSSALPALSGCGGSPGTFVIRLPQNAPSVVEFSFVRQAVRDGEGAVEGEERWAVGCVGVGGCWGVFPCVFPSIQTVGPCSAMM